MQKVFYLLMFSLLFVACNDSDKDDERAPNDAFKSVKVVITRVSSDFSHFFLNTTLTIENDKKNYQINNTDFDIVMEDETNLLLIKKHEPVTSKYEVELKLRDVKIQVLETPMLDSENGDLDWDEFDIDLNTKIEIYVGGRLKSTQSFVFDKNTANINISQYSEK